MVGFGVAAEMLVVGISPKVTNFVPTCIPMRRRMLVNTGVS
jgi:hypothetical protein